MTIDQHLTHLLRLMESNQEGWKAYCWARVKELAERPELAELPMLLEQAVNRKSAGTSPAP